MSASALSPLGAGTLHVAVDMQRLFAEATAWHVPALSGILPHVATLARSHASQTVFTRFMTPGSPVDSPGTWRRYYGHWQNVTLQRMDPALLSIVEPLESLAQPGAVCDKTAYSAFESGAFRNTLSQRDIKTIVVTGVETDVCVLATVFDAVDAGLRVVIVSDAVASASPAGHAAVLDILLPRFDQQVELATLEQVAAAWSNG